MPMTRFEAQEVWLPPALLPRYASAVQRFKAREERFSPRALLGFMAAASGEGFEVRAGATGEPTEILLYDEIGFWGVTAKEFVLALAAVGPGPIRLRINSPGGDTFDGLAIYNALRARTAPVTAVIDGIAASAASLIAMAATRIEMPEQAMLMIHNCWGVCIGNRNDMLEMAAIQEKIDGQMAQIYSKKCGKPSADMASCMDAESYYTSTEAKAIGLCDAIIDPAAAPAAISASGGRALVRGFRAENPNHDERGRFAEGGTEASVSRTLADHHENQSVRQAVDKGNWPASEAHARAAAAYHDAAAHYEAGRMDQGSKSFDAGFAHGNAADQIGKQGNADASLARTLADHHSSQATRSTNKGNDAAAASHTAAAAAYTEAAVHFAAGRTDQGHKSFDTGFAHGNVAERAGRAGPKAQAEPVVLPRAEGADAGSDDLLPPEEQLQALLDALDRFDALPDDHHLKGALRASNPNHDPANGEFSEGGGSAAGKPSTLKARLAATTAWLKSPSVHEMVASVVAAAVAAAGGSTGDPGAGAAVARKALKEHGEEVLTFAIGSLIAHGFASSHTGGGFWYAEPTLEHDIATTVHNLSAHLSVTTGHASEMLRAAVSGLKNLRAAAAASSAANANLRAAATAPEWQCAAAEDLPVDLTAVWDGPAAAERMFDAAGFNGDSPDPAKAKRGFLAWDHHNPKLKGSYKLPFADIVGGELRAVKSGIAAAASRLPDTDIPDPVKASARALLDAYEKKMKPAQSDAKKRARLNRLRLAEAEAA